MPYKYLYLVTPVTKVIMGVLLFCLVIVTPVTAVNLNCDLGSYHFISPNPLTGIIDKIFSKETNHIYTACDLVQQNVSEDFYCITHIYSNSGSNLIQTNPKAVYIEEIGVIDSFSSFGDLANVYFNSENLYVDSEYVYEVICSTEDGDESGIFQKNVTVVYQSMSGVAPLSVWAIGNSAYFIIAIILLLFLILFFKGLKKAW